VINTLDIQDKAAFGKMWHHSVYTALCARYLSKKFEPLLQPGEIWTAAILHDIGRLVYLKFFPDHYKAMIEYCQQKGCLFTEAEEHFSLPPSSYLGTLLCDHWRLPNLIHDVCKAHDMNDLQHLSDEKSHEAFLKIIICANSLALLAAAELNTGTKNRIAEAVKSSLKCTEKEFMVMMGDIYELQQNVEKFI
jgi:HD-like signal output (HDOD) protein